DRRRALDRLPGGSATLACLPVGGSVMDRDVGKELGGAPGGQPYRRGYAASGTAKSSALTNPFKAAKSRTLLAGGGHPGGYKRMTGEGIVRDLSRHRPSPRK